MADAADGSHQSFTGPRTARQDVSHSHLLTTSKGVHRALNFDRTTEHEAAPTAAHGRSCRCTGCIGKRAAATMLTGAAAAGIAVALTLPANVAEAQDADPQGPNGQTPGQYAPASPQYGPQSLTEDQYEEDPPNPTLPPGPTDPGDGLPGEDIPRAPELPGEGTPPAEPGTPPDTEPPVPAAQTPGPQPQTTPPAATQPQPDQPQPTAPQPQPAPAQAAPAQAAPTPAQPAANQYEQPSQPPVGEPAGASQPPAPQAPEPAANATPQPEQEPVADEGAATVTQPNAGAPAASGQQPARETLPSTGGPEWLPPADSSYSAALGAALMALGASIEAMRRAFTGGRKTGRVK